MVTSERNRMIRDIYRAYPYWSYQKIGELAGVSRQRVQQILKEPVKRATIPIMKQSEITKLDREPISATQAAKITGISYGVISVWVSRGQVKIVSRPERARACYGEPVLLDPVSLQERIDRYKPRKKATV